jgi:pyrroline-5-carboxylate reductase
VVKELQVKTTSKNVEAIGKADAIVLAIKPQILSNVMEELKGRIASNQLLLSIIAGATIRTICKGLKHESVVRVIPNTPAQIGKGISAWTATDAVTAEQKKLAEAILNGLGKQIYFEDEKYIDMATAVSGSGPAYIYLIIEALTDAAVHIGLPQHQAEQLVLQTVLGSALFLERTEP